ncbi:MAG: HmuY family protein [Tenacibaculum sp.]
MKFLKTFLFVSVLALISCSDSDEDTIVQIPIESKSITNLYAPAEGQGKPTGGNFTKFSFKEGKQVTGDNWDIAFRATEIIVNGGEKIGLPEEIARTKNAAIALLGNMTLADVKEAPADNLFNQDINEGFALPWGSNNGWYTYTGPPSHAILPKPGIILVVKTIDGNYAKMEIISYYKDNPKTITTSSESRYYTFNYVYNPNKGIKEFQ